MDEGKLREIAKKEIKTTGEPPKNKGVKPSFLKRLIPFALCFFAGAVSGFILNIF